MSVRITTNGLFRTYASAMHRSQKKLYNTLDRVQTNRNFSTYAEDPASASKAFRLRRAYWQNEKYISTSNYLIDKFEVAYTAAAPIVDGDADNPGLDGIQSMLEGLSDATASGRRALGNDLIAKSDAISLCLNARYNGEYVFAGIDGMNVPFTWSGDTLLYRGIDVTSAPGGEDGARLEEMTGETAYVNIGLGMKEDAEGRTIPNSALNSAIDGLSFLGYGVDEDGDPKNMAVLMRELGNIYRRADPDTGDYASPADKERAQVLATKLFDSMDRVREQYIQISSNATYVRTNLNQLETQHDTLSEEITNVEQMDGALAITEMAWAQYSYQAALQTGGQILSQSLFDYMK